MKLYFVYSHSYERILREENVPILFSYLGRGSGISPSLPKGFSSYFIDCGAFSVAWGSAKNPHINAYGHWLYHILRTNKGKDIVYCNLDVIGDAESTMSNQMYLENLTTEDGKHHLGLKPLPVWHEGEPHEYLDYYCQQYDYVCIGGIVGSGINKPKIEKMINEVSQKYPKTKFHFFGIGISGGSAFKSFRPYSVDFSTWSVPARFGHSIIENKGSIKEKALNEEERQKLRIRAYSEEEMRKAIRLISKFGENIENSNESYQRRIFQ